MADFEEFFSNLLDSKDILPGTQWVERLEAGLQSCQAFALIATRQAMASRFVQTEYAVAVDLAHEPGRSLQLIALLFDDVKLPPILRTFQAVDFRSADRFEDGIDALCRGLRRTPTADVRRFAPHRRASDDVDIKLRYVERELARERRSIRDLVAVRGASLVTGVLIALAFTWSGIATSIAIAVLVAIAAVLAITAAGWSVTFPWIADAKSHVAKLELLRDGLSTCAGQSSDTCVEWHAHFWRVFPGGIGIGR